MGLVSRVCFLMAAMAATGIVGGCAGGRAAQEQSPPAVASTPAAGAVGHDGSTATLVVHGMGCPLCANNVDKQLLKVSGVEKVNVDLGSGKVKVSFASGVARPSDDKLAKAVANSGYTLVRIQTP